MPAAVDVVVRLGDDVVAVARVAGRTFRIGTARDVDLAVDVAPLVAFPLVDATGDAPVIRRPAGVAAVRGDRGGEAPVAVTEAAWVLAVGERVVLRLGRHVVVELERVEPAAVGPRVPGPALEWRPLSYVAAALAAHLALWAIAATRPPEPRRRAVRVVYVGKAEPEPEPKPRPRPKPKPRPRPKPKPKPRPKPKPDPSPKPDGRPRPRRALLPTGDPVAASADGDGLGTGTGMGDFQWTVYDEDAANARGFGGANARRFDPDLDITLCGPGCTVDGPLVRVVFEHALDARREELAACAADLPSGGDIVLVLDVAPDGHVTTATATGLAAAAPCITDLARHLAFPHDVAATHARIPIHFAAR